MLSTVAFSDPFRRFRLRSPSPPDVDSDNSSPERVPRLLARRPTDRRVTLPESEKHSRALPGKSTATTHIALPFNERPHAIQQPPQNPSMSGPAWHPDHSLEPPPKSSLMRRVTSKLHISIPSKPSNQALRSHPSTRTLPSQSDSPQQQPRSPKTAPALPNAFVSREHREAALRERGLRPPRKDLSIQEREADERLASVPLPSCDCNGLSEAERLKASWLAKNRSPDSPDSDLAPIPPPKDLPPVPGVPAPSPPPPPSRSSSAYSDAVSRRSSDSRSDLPSVGRPSIGSSVPPLSASSCLEVLHEEPSELPPITPPHLASPARVPIIVSCPVESPPSPVFVESPISCTFSSHYPGSLVESLSPSDHSRSPAKCDLRRGRRSESGDRPRQLVSSSLSRAGTRSLSNLRRSLVGSLRLPSSSTLSSADLPPSPTHQAPRAAISPTIHSLGSIIREAKGIADAESRRLSEIAFLD